MKKKAVSKRLTRLMIIIVTLTLRLAPAWAQGISSNYGPGYILSNSETRTMGFYESDSATLSTLPWNKAVKNFSSPEDICKAVKRRVQYSRDMFKEDEWRSGRETWEKREGDCEDIAAVVRDLCREKGYKAEIYVIYSKTARAAHAVTIGEHNGVVWVSNNGSYSEHQSLFDAKQEIARDQGWWMPELEMTKRESDTK
jgi:hypothetical protein